jgi:hypothetical protein
MVNRRKSNDLPAIGKPPAQQAAMTGNSSAIALVSAPVPE